MSNKIIALSETEDLKIFMSPVRQKLLRCLHINGCPMTAKAIADSLGISPSSAKHHINKLESLGIVELSHTELINGITARYYKASDVTVSIGSELEDDLTSEKNIIVENLIKNTLDGFRNLKKANIPHDEIQNCGDFLNGIVHLSPADSLELLELIRNFIDTHQVYTEGSQPWEYSLILYNAGLTE